MLQTGTQSDDGRGFFGLGGGSMSPVDNSPVPGLQAAPAASVVAAAPIVPHQLVLALGYRESFDREDFFPGKGNEAALALIERWPDWPSRSIALVGPEGAGKTHLAAVWARAAGGRVISARAVEIAAVPAALSTGALVVEDADREPLNEPALFHLLNLGSEQRAFVLLTARSVPTRWLVDLPDLASRLRAVPVATLSPPDDAMLGALLVKLFADRQLAVDDGLIGYLVNHIERSFAAARAAVAELDEAALRLRRPVNRTLAAEIRRQQPP
jgi:chromosomal replication initiation ATPase DnaA